MKYDSGIISGINIAYIGGGSRLWAPQLMKDLACEDSLSGTVRLYDIDHDAAADNAVIGNMISDRGTAKGKWTYRTFNDIDETLDGADFIIMSILPGTLDEMAADVHAPEKYGIFQSVGDTTGPGGLLRAMRTIPIYADFAVKIKKYAPDAWVINYTNPMALCTRTLYEIFPEVKAFGCCHEVFGTQELLREMLYDAEKIETSHRNEIKINVLGINHFTWLDMASYQHIDLFPLYKNFSDKYFNDGFKSPGIEKKERDIFISSNRVKFDLFRKFGLIAAAGDRHLAEFLPSSWYLKDRETVKKWKFMLTPVETRVKIRDEANELRKNIISGKTKPDIKPTGEEGVKQMKALLGLGDLVTNVNLPNRGQLKGFPDGAIVETNAIFTKNSIKPVVAGELPPDIHNIIVRHSYNHELILKAALTKNKDLAYHAMLNDPLISIGPDDVKVLLDEMINLTSAYLPGWKD